MRAIDLTRADRPSILAGDAMELLPSALATIAADSVPCVFHCHTLNQFHPANRERFLALLALESKKRPLCLLSLEGLGIMPMSSRPDPGPDSELWLTLLADGRIAEQRLLARYQAHGEWLRWL